MNVYSFRALFSGILVPGGFGQRGVDGMILAIKYAREQKIPFLGICLGFQLAVIEWARNVLEIPGVYITPLHSFHRSSSLLDATSTEFVIDAKHPVIIFMPEISKTHMGGTMRLGLRPTVFEPGTESWSQTRKLYAGAGKIWERHRHRYEVNPKYVKQLNDSGLVFAGKDEKGERMQLLELSGAFYAQIGESNMKLMDLVNHFPLPRSPQDHPYFIGLQAHPEFCTRPLNPSPPFLGFVAAASGQPILDEQLEYQMNNFQPPHPTHSMVGEAALRQEEDEVFVNGTARDLLVATNTPF
jgi:CTP synthase